MSSVNFPPKMEIGPSTELFDLEGVVPHEYTQDVENFGIAGRIWQDGLSECQLCSNCLSNTSKIEFAPKSTLKLGNSPKVIVELGSGTGYVGLEVARCCSHSDLVILTDLDEVVPLLANNMHTHDEKTRNASCESSDVWAQPLAWGSENDVKTLGAQITQHYGAPIITHIICSDLVYFPPLLPLLLRTLLALTSAPWNAEKSQVEILFSYKIRSLAFESPFWAAFGFYFTFEPVFCRRKMECALHEGPHVPQWSDWVRLGAPDSCDDAMDGEAFLFIARRKPESLNWTIPAKDEELMNSQGDSYFESLLMLAIDV